MTPLIPALINLLVSGIRKKGGGVGGGGKPPMSEAEKDDQYWHKRNMSSDAGDFLKTMDSINRGYQRSGAGGSNSFDKAYGKYMGAITPPK